MKKNSKFIILAIFAMTFFSSTTVFAQKPNLSNASTFKVQEGVATSLYTGLELKNFINVGVGSGTVTSVGVTTPTGFSVTGSPITSNGTIGITNNMAAGVVKSAGVGGALSSGLVNLGTEITGTTAVANGGTGATTLATGYLRGNGTSAITSSTTVPSTDISGTLTNAQLTNSLINHTVAQAGTAVGFSATNTSLGGTATLNVPLAASGVTSGTVSNAAQSFSGLKTFSNGLVTNGSTTVEAANIVGSVRNNQISLTSATTLDASHNQVSVSATSATFTVTLPLCSATNLGVSYNFTRTDATTTTSVNLTTSGSDVFVGGGATRSLNSQGVSVVCTCSSVGTYTLKW